MSSTALRAVRELRGDAPDGRPFTPRGERPGTAAGMRAASPDDAASALGMEALRKELEETKLALEKEKRNTRSLEQYITELTETKDNEIKEALAEAKVHQLALGRAEAHATSIEDMYKAQVHKLTMTLERMTQAAAAGQPASKDEMDASFAAVLRDEMRTMSAAFTAKLAKATADATARQSESAKLIRTLQEQILEQKRNNSSLVDKIARGPASVSPSSAADAASPPGTGPIFAATAAARAQSGATGASSAAASKPAPAAAASSSSTSAASAPSNGALSSRTAAATSAASSMPTGTKPVVKSSALKTK